VQSLTEQIKDDGALSRLPLHKSSFLESLSPLRLNIPTRTIQTGRGVHGLSITITDVDLEAVSANVTIEEDEMDYDVLATPTESTSAVVHSIDDIGDGKKIIEMGSRKR
jgi:hypothetical protein